MRSSAAINADRSRRGAAARTLAEALMASPLVAMATLTPGDPCVLRVVFSGGDSAVLLVADAEDAPRV